jgi:hypothetical protein
MEILKYQSFISGSSASKRFGIVESEEGEKAYSFDELSDTAKEKALSIFREDEDLIYQDWEESVINDFEEDLRDFGIDNIECNYSGFYSQGDGASFTGNITDNRKFIEETLGIKNMRPEVYDHLYLYIRRISSRYVHENTIDLNADVDSGEEELEFPVSADFSIIIDLKKEAEIIEKKGTEWAREKSSELYRRLEREYDYLRSDDNIENFIVSNDYEFDVEGNLL